MTLNSRFTKTILSLMLAAALFLPVPTQADGAFAAFLLDAEQMDFPHQILQVDLYRRDEAGIFQAADTVRYSCQINRVTGQAEFHIQPQADDVWVTVDYLTDVNQDGIYEMLDGQDAPVCDGMDRRGRLYEYSRKGAQYLQAGETYILSAETLANGARAAIRDRNGDRNTSVLYLVSLRRTGTDGLVQELCYYLQLHDVVLPPLDVPADAPYYDDVIYAMEHGFLSGTGNSRFSPDLELTRAQLAQILWSITGAPTPKEGGYAYSDVTPAHWFYKSASWCSEVGLMAGVGEGLFSPETKLTWEQLSLILMQYTRHIGENYSRRGDLSGYADASSVSFWAQESMSWAAANGLIPTRADNTLRPQHSITRAELATALHIFCETFDI